MFRKLFASLFLLLGALSLTACGEDDEPADTANDTASDTELSCVTVAEGTVDDTSFPAVLTANGSVTCTAPVASLAIEVCAQLDGADSQCASASESNIGSLQSSTQISCMGTKEFRVRVSSTRDGVVEEVFSEPQTVECN